MPNGINDSSPDLRDWLLNKNLIIADSVADGGLDGYTVGLGQQASISSQPIAVQASTSIVDNGRFYRELGLSVNPYKALNGNDEIDINTSTVVNIGNLPPGTQPLGYQQNIGSENVKSDFNSFADTAREQMSKNKYFDSEHLRKVNLNTAYISSSAEGIYQFKAAIGKRRIDSLLNAVNLGGVAQQVGDIGDDSEMGLIADNQLIKHFGYNAAFGVSQETLGRINLNPLSLLQGNDVFVPNFTLTVPRDSLGSVVDFSAKVLGFEIQVSLLDQSASIFSSENSVDNITRLNSMIVNTGKGQVLAMIDNLNQNKYKPTITDDRKRIGVTKGDTGTNGELYAFGTGEKGRIIDLLNTTPKSALENGTLSSLSEKLKAAGQGGIEGAADIGFEEKYGKITSELDGGFNKDFGIGPDENVSEYGEDGTYVDKYAWGDDENNKPGKRIFQDDKFKAPKSLLFKTQELFKTNKMRTLVTGKAVKGQVKGEIQSAVHHGHISKGSGVLSRAVLLDSQTGLTGEEIFCRTWTTFDRYNQVQDLQKSGSGGDENWKSGINPNGGSTIRKNLHGSVLDTNGFVRIAPKVGDDEGVDEFGETKIKKFMFSIENLAWNGFQNLLPNCEKGQGDLITGTRGRVMWFPPYGMNFTDNSSVNWDATNFIGRGEPVYTYNNTERTGTLQFQMIIDHATYINDMRDAGASDEMFASMAAGCVDLDSIIGQKLNSIEKSQIEVANAQAVDKIEVLPQTPPAPYKVYFPNDVVTISSTYENGDGVGLGSILASDGYITSEVNGSVHSYPDNTDYGLNSCSSGDCPQGQKINLNGVEYDGWDNNTHQVDLVEYIIDQCPACKVSLTGWASQDGETTAADANQRLSEDRATSVANYLKQQLKLAGDELADERFEIIQGDGATGCPAKIVGDSKNEVDVLCKKTSRFTEVTFTYDETLDVRLAEADKPKEVAIEAPNISVEVKKRFFNECSYFKKIEQNDKFVYATIKEKVKYFHPAFHSITPEGFNSRLNFLQQCTRQGPTFRENTPSNLAFGTPPVCILRIGDFYHTKIIIDSISHSFDPLVWDLNPEGVGVQPMICTVDLSFKFIGGSSLQGPINRLQNAVSFNFFANTEIYDDRADYIAKPSEDHVIVNGINPNSYGDKESSKKTDGLSSGIDKNPQPDTDQEKRLEKTLSDSSVEEELAEERIVGYTTIKTVPSTYLGTNEDWLLTLKVKKIGLTTDAAIAEYITKPIKISITNSSGFIFEHILTNGEAEGLLLGQTFIDIVIPSVGDYQLSLSYDGDPLANSNITITNAEWVVHP